MIDVLKLFPIINQELFDLLEELSEDDWNKQTVINSRSVKDIAAHILDGSIRRLSYCRDKFQGEKARIGSYEDLIEYIQKMNREWISATKRVSPQILLQLLKIFENEVYHYFKDLDLEATAPFSVAWAGEKTSKNWFDIAREYTEKWHHQMQIRLAVGKPVLTSEELFRPIFSTFMIGLPFAYRNLNTEEKTKLKVTIEGASGGSWVIIFIDNRWNFYEEPAQEIDNEVIIHQDIAWRIFTNCVDMNCAKKEILVSGDRRIGEHILNMRTVLS